MHDKDEEGAEADEKGEKELEKKEENNGEAKTEPEKKVLRVIHRRGQ